MSWLAIWVVKYLLPALAWLRSIPMPGARSQDVFREARSKACVMELVNNVDRTLGPALQSPSLNAQLKACYALENFEALFAVEGLGFHLAEELDRRGSPGAAILTGDQTASVPSKSLSMLHAGIGISFARQSFEGFGAHDSSDSLGRSLERFRSLCEKASQPGYLGCALESLGIPTVILHGLQMPGRLHSIWSRSDPIANECMWRGVGRALYFSPKNFVPRRSRWPGFALADALAPDATARLNMHAGMAWAITMVNLRDPHVMESVLRERANADPEARSAFVSGVVSARLIRHDTTPDDPLVDAFVAHRPHDETTSRLWEHDIAVPCRTAMRDVYPVLRASGGLDTLFRYQQLDS